MSWICVDVESSGPCPGIYSMVALGAVKVSDLGCTFHGLLKPEPDHRYNEEALAVSGFTYEDTLKHDDPTYVMQEFKQWILDNSDGLPIFVSDNNGFDFAFVNYYFHEYVGSNPFGWSSKNINSLYHGLTKDTRASFKHLRKTPHDHNPVNDSLGNAESLLYMRDHLGLKVKF